MEIYSESVSDENNPFSAWLINSNENILIKQCIIEKLNHIFLTKDSTEKNTIRKILDVGCSWGSTSFKIIEALNKFGLNYEYYGLDPFEEQLVIFKELAAKKNITNLQLINGTLEDYNSSRDFDLVFTSHSLYYVNDIKVSLEKLLELGKVVIIVHQGKDGINLIHNEFKDFLKQRPYINLTYQDILNTINSLNYENKYNIEVSEQIGLVNVAHCKDENSEQGRALISFFLEHDYQNIPEKTRKDIHNYFRINFPETMPNDFGIIFVYRR